MTADRGSRPPMNVKRVVLGIVGLVLGFILLAVGLNTLSQPPEPEPSSVTRPPRGTAAPGSTAPPGSTPGTTGVPTSR